MMIFSTSILFILTLSSFLFHTVMSANLLYSSGMKVIILSQLLSLSSSSSSSFLIQQHTINNSCSVVMKMFNDLIYIYIYINIYSSILHIGSSELSFDGTTSNVINLSNTLQAVQGNEARTISFNILTTQITTITTQVTTIFAT